MTGSRRFPCPRRSIWRRSPRARRARLDLLLAVAMVGGALGLAFYGVAAAGLREAMRVDPLGTFGALALVATAPAGAALWCLSRRRDDAERLIAHLRRRAALAGIREEAAPPPKTVDGAEVARVAAALEAATALRVAQKGAADAAPADVLRRVTAALASSAAQRETPPAAIHLEALLAKLSIDVASHVAADAPALIVAKPRLLAALLDNLVVFGRGPETPVVEACAHGRGLALTVARHRWRDETPALPPLRRRAAALLGGALETLIEDDDVVVDQLALPPCMVSSRARGYSAAAA